MEDIEHEMREELRHFIKDGVSKSKVSAQIDMLLTKMDAVAALFSNQSDENMRMKTLESMDLKPGGGYPNSPHMQIKNGIAPSDVICKDGLELMWRISTDMPICVYPSSVERLLTIGFADYY